MYDFYMKSEERKAIELDFSGTSPSGETVSIDSISYKKNGKACIPIIGEFPYARYSECEWEKGLRKMKAGGIERVSSYIFWIYHEEEKGIYRFDGDRNIRKFAELCQKVGLTFMLRIGPWVTGECKNGGFPDWVLDLPDVHGKAHGNTPQFMSAVRSYFEKLYEQVQGLMYKDGGPIVSIQLENEYTIHRAINVQNGIEYLHELKKMIVDIGFDVPFYSRTAWGTAIMSYDELLPLFGAYCDAPWAKSLDEEPALNRFLITDQRYEDVLGKSIEANFDPNDLTNVSEYLKVLYPIWESMKPTPYLTIELGGGMQPSIHRRIVSEKDDTECLTVCMLGRGANSLGYYVYHGGTNGNGKLSSLESTANVVMAHKYPKKSYDFGAPIGEDTMLKESYHALKRRFLAVKELEEVLAVSDCHFPDENATEEKDLISPRISVRFDPKSKSGFVFINNHVRKNTMPLRNFDINIHYDDKVLSIPKLILQNHDMRIIPFNLDLIGGKLISTNTEFLTRIDDRYYFYTNEKPIYNTEGDIKITTLDMHDSLYAWKFDEKLLVCEKTLYQVENDIYLESIDTDCDVSFFDNDGNKITKQYHFDEIKQENPSFKLTKETENEKVYIADLSKMQTENVEDILMTTKYLGDSAELYADGEIISDWYTTGEDYTITLKRFNYPKEIEVRVTKSADRDTRYFDLPVKHGFELSSIKLNSIYKTICRK